MALLVISNNIKNYYLTMSFFFFFFGKDLTMSFKIRVIER